MEVDLRRKLVQAYSALGLDFYVDYVGLHLICFNYGKYGHKVGDCVSLDLLIKGTPVAMKVA